MRIYTTWMLVTVVAALSAGLASRGAADECEIVPNRVLVKFRAGAVAEAAAGATQRAGIDRFAFRSPVLEARLAALNIRRMEKLLPTFTRELMPVRRRDTKPITLPVDMTHVYVIDLFAGDVWEAIRSLKELTSEIESAGPDFIVHALATPNDPLYGHMWGMNNTGVPPDIDIDAPEAWDLVTRIPARAGKRRRQVTQGQALTMLLRAYFASTSLIDRSPNAVSSLQKYTPDACSAPVSALPFQRNS